MCYVCKFIEKNKYTRVIYVKNHSESVSHESLDGKMTVTLTLDMDVNMGDRIMFLSNEALSFCPNCGKRIQFASRLFEDVIEEEENDQ